MISRPIAPAIVAALCLVLPGSAAAAQGLVTMQKMSAALANELVGETVANCARAGYPVSAVLVDLDGVRQAVLRGDNAPIHSIDNAFLKAYTAASITLVRKEDSTRAVSERMAKSPPTTVPQVPPPNVTYSAGGVTVIVGDKPIGGIGVSGAPNGKIDEDCARAAIAKIQGRLK